MTNNQILGNLVGMVIWPRVLKDRLEFARGVLMILRDTRLFCAEIDDAIEDIDYVMAELEALRNKDD